MPPLHALWGDLGQAERRLLLSLTRSPRQLRALVWWRWALRDFPLARRRIAPAASDRLRFARWLAESGRIGEDDGATTAD